MENLEKIKRLLRNASSITQLFNSYIPKWKDRPSHYDKTGYEFNVDERFAACKSVNVFLSSHEGTYGDSGCGRVISLDDDIFSKHLIKYLNKNKDVILLAIAEQIKDEARLLKEKAESELKSQLENIQSI